MFIGLPRAPQIVAVLVTCLALSFSGRRGGCVRQGAGRQRGSGQPAAQAGLRTGDVIVAVNRQPVRTVAELTRLLAETRGTIALDLFRGGARLLLVVR